VPGQVDPSVLMGLAAAFVLSTIPGLAAVAFFGMLRVTRKSYDDTQAALVTKRIERATEVPPVPPAATAT
jgi:hypothetical protein